MYDLLKVRELHLPADTMEYSFEWTWDLATLPMLTSSQTLRVIELVEGRKVFENLKLLVVTTCVYLHLKKKILEE